MTHGKLITRCNVVQRTVGCEGFEAIKEVMFKSAVFKLIDHAATELANAGFTEPHLLEFNLTLHAYEVEE